MIQLVKLVDQARAKSFIPTLLCCMSQPENLLCMSQQHHDIPMCGLSSPHSRVCLEGALPFKNVALCAARLRPRTVQTVLELQQSLFPCTWTFHVKVMQASMYYPTRSPLSW